MFTTNEKPDAGNVGRGNETAAGAAFSSHVKNTAASNKMQTVTTKTVPGRVLILLNGGKVATVRGDTLYRTIHRSKHVYRGAICFLNRVLETAEALGAKKCVCRDADPDGKTYTAHMNDVWIHSWPLENDYGIQRALPLTHWATTAAEAAAQLSLWDGGQ